jgi:hypothetical protein
MKNNSNYSPKIIRLTENNLVKIIEKVINNDWLRISLLKKQVKLWSEIAKVRKCH